MNLAINLQLRQSQSLALTPQLLQSIRLLQYGHLELKAFIEREAERNPLIKVAAATPGGRSSSAGTGASSRGFDPHVLEATLAERVSLAAHARAEMADILTDPAERRIGAILLADLDEAGYLRVDPDAVAPVLSVGVEELRDILTRLRAEAEPAGLFAADLADCLRIQLDRRGRLDPVIACVLDNLDLLAKRDFAALRRLTGEDEAGLMAILGEIRSLDPKPGAGFADVDSERVRPEIVVLPDAQDGWRVELNEKALPRVLVDGAYAARVSQGCRDDAELAFVGECQASASWLARALDQRAKTMLKVACEIVRRQSLFLTEGVAGLRPMTLAQVAEEVGLHESTISRVTANKFVQTPRGTFELKYFFTVAIASTTGGEAHSAEDVKGRIRRLVAGEHAGFVLSDEDIVARLKAEGVDLARRTVAKYREGMGIASSVQRRRELNALRLAS